MFQLEKLNTKIKSCVQKNIQQDHNRTRKKTRLIDFHFWALAIASFCSTMRHSLEYFRHMNVFKTLVTVIHANSSGSEIPEIKSCFLRQESIKYSGVVWSVGITTRVVVIGIRIVFLEGWSSTFEHLDRARLHFYPIKEWKQYLTMY